MKYSVKSDGSSKRSFWKSVNAALEGIVHTLQGERNMRIHFFIAFLTLIAALYFEFHYIEFLMLLFAISFVLVTEMINTAIEYLSDITSKESFHPLIKVVKDIAAGGVFVSAVNACLTGYILLANRMNLHRGTLFSKIKQSPYHITLIAMLICVGTVLFVKIMRGEKNLLKGGMPSGHSAVAFAVWMMVWLLTSNTLISILVFFMAVVIARSRMIAGIHNLGEIAIGGVLGALSALLVYQVLS